MKNLEYCKRQIQLSMLRAQWWIASATSGHCQQRKLYHGPNAGPAAEYTAAEKLDAAMETAMRHIRIAAEFSDNLCEEEVSASESTRKPDRPFGCSSDCRAPGCGGGCSQ